MKELQVIVSCPAHGEKARIYRVPADNEHVFHNVTEPAEMQGVQLCPECEEPLEFTRK